MEHLWSASLAKLVTLIPRIHMVDGNLEKPVFDCLHPRIYLRQSLSCVLKHVQRREPPKLYVQLEKSLWQAH